MHATIVITLRNLGILPRYALHCHCEERSNEAIQGFPLAVNLSLRGDAVAVAIHEPKLPCALNPVIASFHRKRSNLRVTITKM
ncbi:hypothetical protein OFO10_02465 [Campylobacter sp. VBCF_06 NA8]|uniref:hypothetical protein n=1 Tax=Campylobacter sp. VBCF_06 NA8 TaxID=2983822 RepID=UPI0022E9B325|nr:hypothetical protein [Campylobacter sp. VBCF_06 NA8]MDA3046015.1 hypothetical protein [Campylobacter sp. VBCF_06 NA8]